MSTNETTEFDGFDAFDGETYGESHGYDDLRGLFKRDAQNSIRLVNGPPMVAEHLVRILRTPVGTNTLPNGLPPRGSDPLRPKLGLDRQRVHSSIRSDGTDTSGAETKQAIIDAIGPDAVPWVERLGPGDIQFEFDAGNRVADIGVTAYLADGTPITFAMGFRDLLGQSNFEQAEATDERDGQTYGAVETTSGFGGNFGEDFGQ